jgi:hypothetical protein
MTERPQYGLSDDEVDELIRVAHGGIKKRIRAWYTLGVPIEFHYGLDEQLVAIRRLGLSINRKARAYLVKLSQSITTESTPSGPARKDALTYYPHAHGDLRNVLDFVTVTDDSSSMIWEQQEKHPKHELAVRTIKEALLDLEQAFED